MDADAVYPIDYVPRVKEWIVKIGDEHPVLCATRRGGFGHLFFPNHEHGLIIRRDVFLERTKDYPNNIPPIHRHGKRTDVAPLFRDAVRIPVEYYHGFTTGELQALGLGTIIVSTIVSVFRRSRALKSRHS